MLEMLRRFEQEGDEMAKEELLSDDDDEESTDAETIWNKLTPYERNEFKSKFNNNPNDLLYLVKDLPLWKPWWEDLTTINRQQKIMELDVKDKDGSTNRPPILKDIKRLENLTKKSPNSNLVFNLVNVLYAYARTCRNFNGDIFETPEDSILAIWELSPILGTNESLVYENVSEAITIGNNVTLQNPNYIQPPEFWHLILNDIICLLSSSDNVLAALSDIYNLFHQVSTNKTFASKSSNPRVDDPRKLSPRLSKESYKRKIFLTEKKIYFYLSYTNSLRQTDIPELVMKEVELEKERKIKEFENYRKDKESIEEMMRGGRLGKDQSELKTGGDDSLITEI
ncbi:17210_t:CDS:2 [Acaulospora colombiana]|uniref:17210_t:CDS:1 n=1 Tax=Acaulospora colombiana TaxID=27376 RepID=A0ACA9JZ32_9GLOM|nr:17210_t:CDS:2 [Acaulospora colombiana]